MRVILEVQFGRYAGRKTWLSRGQTLTVGRTQTAEFSLPHDSEMSGEHFSVQCAADGCRVRDLGSTNGTRVDNRRIEDETYHQDTVVQAGTTTFLIHVLRQEPVTQEIQPTAKRERVPEQVESTGSSATVSEASPESSIPQSAGPASECVAIRSDSRLADDLLHMTVVAGPGRERQTWLRPGQTIAVGRTHSSDFAIEGDSAMSSRHFYLSHEEGLWYLSDLQSLNGTQLNEQLVQRQWLRNGDQIQAGASVFEIGLKGSQPLRQEDEIAERGDAAAGMESMSSIAFDLAQRWPCSSLNCATGMLLWRGDEDRFEPLDIVNEVIDRSGLHAYLIVAATHGDLFLDHAESPIYLFDWLSSVNAKSESPRIIPVTESAQLTPISDVWGKDVVVCLLCSGDPDETITNIRRLAKGESEETNERGPAIGSFLPSAVVQLLANGDCTRKQLPITGIDAVFVELHEGQRWGIFVA